MLTKLKEASTTAKLGYLGLIITVVLGLSNIGGKAWTQVIKVDSRYAKQAYVQDELQKTNTRITMVEQNLDINRFLQLEQQLWEMSIRYGADMSKWTEAQKALYWQKKSEYDALKRKLGR